MSKTHTSKKKKLPQTPEPKKGKSDKTSKKIVEFFLQTGELTRKLEVIKEMLAEEEQFTPSTLFYRLDEARKGYLTEPDIAKYLEENNIKYKGSELKILFGRIDSNQDGVVSKRQFQDFILPNQNPKVRYFAVRRPGYIPSPGEQLDSALEWIVCKFFKEIIGEYGKLSEVNNSLVNSYDFSLDDLFKELSADGKTINGQDLLRYASKLGFDLSPEDVGGILSIIDPSGKNQINKGALKSYVSTLGVKQQHQLFDETGPIPKLKGSQKGAVKSREASLKQRYKDNKQNAKGMDQDAHHIFGYSRYLDQGAVSTNWLGFSRNI